MKRAAQRVTLRLAPVDDFSEVRELLDEAGFRRSVGYWEDSAPDGGSGGAWRRRSSAPAEAVWIAMVVGVK